MNSEEEFEIDYKELLDAFGVDRKKYKVRYKQQIFDDIKNGRKIV